jgi:hypothetical protein
VQRADGMHPRAFAARPGKHPRDCHTGIVQHRFGERARAAGSRRRIWIRDPRQQRLRHHGNALQVQDCLQDLGGTHDRKRVRLGSQRTRRDVGSTDQHAGQLYGLLVSDRHEQQLRLHPGELPLRISGRRGVRLDQGRGTAACRAGRASAAVHSGGLWRTIRQPRLGEHRGDSPTGHDLSLQGDYRQRRHSDSSRPRSDVHHDLVACSSARW